MPFHVFLSHSSADKPAGRNIEGETLTPAAENPLSGIQGDCLEIEAELSFDEPTVCDLIIRASSDQAECTTITYHSAERILTVDGSRSSLDPDVDRPTISGPLGPDHQGVVRFRVFLDRSVLEVFAADRACVTHRLYPTREDSLGLGYDALKEKGFRIPEDVSVIGFDNQELLAAHSRPPLTTVRIPYFEMGSWAVDQLMDAEPNKNIRRGNLRPVESRDRRFHSTTKI